MNGNTSSEYRKPHFMVPISVSTIAVVLATLGFVNPQARAKAFTSDDGIKLERHSDAADTRLEGLLTSQEMRLNRSLEQILSVVTQHQALEAHAGAAKLIAALRAHQVHISDQLDKIEAKLDKMNGG